MRLSSLPALLVIASACHHHIEARAGRESEHTSAAAASVAQPVDPGEAPSGSWDPANRTSMTLGYLHGRVLKYRQENGELPQSLDALTADGRRPVDGWNRVIAYRRGEPDRFELRSAGEDARFQTADDVYVRAHGSRSLPCLLVVAGRTYDHSEGSSECVFISADGGGAGAG